MSSRMTSALAWLAARLPTVLVLAGLVGVGIYGTSVDWKVPWLTAASKEKEKKDEDEEGDPLSPVVLPSEDSAAGAGLEVDSAREVRLSREVEAPAVLAFEEARYARVSAPLGGSVWRIPARTGDRVKKGDVLALLASPELGTAK